MTITLAPDPNPRRLDRAPQAKRHVGPYYGHALRRVLAGTPPRSVVDRLTTWYCARRWPAYALLALGCALLGAAIVAATYGWRVA